jgi:hypothetical protein
MHRLPQVGSLEIEQDLPFEHTQWGLQRAGWVIGGLILLVALAGLLGTGPLSHHMASSGPLSLQYERFTRARAPSEIRLNVGTGLAAPDGITIWLDRAFLDGAGIEQIVPEPIEMVAVGDRVLYRFAVADPAQPTTITFHTAPASWGTTRGRIGLRDGAEITFDQMVYP